MRGHLSRRDFLHVTSGASVGAALLGHGAFEGASEPASDQRLTGMEGWFDRPMRWVQLTLVENDPGRFDPDFWLDYFRRLHADAATLSAGGIVAYYPTRIPLHH